MRHPQVVVYESDGWLAGQVRRLAAENSWIVRESRSADACRQLLADSGPCVVLLRLERDLMDGLSLLENLVEHFPDRPVILVSDVKMDGADQRSQLSALALDLGASFVLFPPLQTPVIEDLVSGLLAAAVRRAVGAAANESDDA
jgi:chemotaxis response regulator CheB